jgi:subtilisin family serine protease
MLLKSSIYELSAVVLATIIVLTSTLGPLLSVGVRADIIGEEQNIRVQGGRQGSVKELAGPSIANHTRVVLITGDVVHLYMLTNGTSRVAVEPADPSRVNRSFKVLEDGDALYVIPSDAPLDKLDIALFNVKLLAKQMWTTRLNTTLHVIVKPVRGVSLQQLTNTVSAIRNEVKAEHRARIIHGELNLASLTIDTRQPEKVKTLLDRTRSIIEKIWLDRVHKVDISQFRPMLDVSVPKVGADWVWVNSQMSGENVKIAVLDTGIDLTHRDFKYLNGTSKVIAAESFVDYPPEDIGNPADYHGHGTHVSGIAAGTGLTEFVDPNTLSPIAHPLIKRQGTDEAAHIAGNGTHLVVVWHSDVSGNWDIWYTVYDGSSWTPTTRLTTDPLSDTWPYVAILPNNKILVAWSSDRAGGRLEIFYKVYLNGRWTSDKQLTINPTDHDYAPAFTTLPDGTIGIIWSSTIVGSNNSDIYFAKLSLASDGTLSFIGSPVRLTNASPSKWFIASSLTLTSSGSLYAFWADLSNFNSTTNWGGITTMYYNVSSDNGVTWSGYTLASCSGCIQPYGIELSNGTLVVFFSGDDFEHNVPDTTYLMKLVGGSWDGPYWLPSDVWHRWRPSAAYGPGGLYVAFTSPGRPWEYYGNDIYITTPKPRYMGVAPKANLLEGKVLNRYGWGFSSWVIAGIEWAVAKRADIISMSLGGGPTDGNDPLSLAVDWAFDQGVLVVVAAGNFGKYFGVAAPGAARKALTVGAVDDSDNIAWFSSRGPTLDYRVKPEIVAPGVGICSSVPYYVFGVSYSCWSGTSMATPHVAGAAALAKQFARNYFGFDAPPEILRNALLVESTDDLGYNIYEQGAGRLDIKKLIAQSSVFGYGGVWIRSEVINFGLVARGTEISAEILIEEFRRGRMLSLELEVRDLFTGELRNNVAQLNTTTVEIGSGGQKAVKLTILPTAPAGLYSGKIRITDNYTQTYNLIFGVTILNTLSIHKIPMEGPGQEQFVEGDIVGVNILDPDFELEFYAGRRWGRFDSAGNAYFLLPNGTYEVYTLGEYNYKPVFLTHDNLALNDNTAITLDEGMSYEVVFDPAKNGQIFAEVFHGLMSETVCPPALGVCYRFTGPWWIGYYPRETSVYYSYSDVLWSVDRYVYYPRDDMNPADPRIISTGVWHDLIYEEKGISSPKTRVADYSLLVTKQTEYRTTAVPRQAAERAIFASQGRGAFVTIVWSMNVPYSRTEIVSPDTSFYGFYMKVADLPGLSTPYWEYYGWFWTGGMAGLETKEVWGEQPLFPTVKFVDSWDAGSGRFDIILGAETFADSNYYHVQWFHSRCPLDNINFKVYRDGVEIPIDYWSIWWCFWGDYYLGLWSQTPAKYTLKTTAYENQPLSTRTVIEYDFRLNSDGSISRAPVVTNIDVKDLSLNNTLERPRVDIKFQLWNETAIQQLTFEYSVDSGATWLSAPVNAAGPNTYTASFTVYGQKYVSIRINATDTNNLKTSTTTIDGFFVKGALTLADFPAPFVVDGGLRNTYIVIGDLEPHGGFGIKAYVTDAADAVILGYYLGRASRSGNVEIVIDGQIARYNYSTNIVKVLDATHNLITFASAKVNMITWYYFTDYVAAYSGFGRESPSPVHFYRPWVPEGQPVRTWIKFPNEQLTYSDWDEEYYPFGTPKSAYGLIALYYDDANGRYVLCVSGIATSQGNKAALLVLTAKLSGQQLPFEFRGIAMLVKWYDSNGNGEVEVSEITLVKSWP